MAIPTGTPTTTTSLTNAIPSYFEKVLLEWMRPQFRFYTYATKKPLPNNYGTSIKFNRKQNLAWGYMLSQGYPLSAVKTLSTGTVSALIEQIGDTVGLADIAKLATVMDSDAYAMEVMADQAAESVEQYIIEAITADTVVNHYVKKDAAIAQGGFATKTSAASNTRLALSDIRAVATNLAVKNVKPYDGTNYVGIFHPYHVSDIMGDSAYTGWVQYTKPENMENFEIGKVFNVRVAQSTKIPITSGSAYSVDSLSTLTASAAKVYGAVIFGEEAFAVSELGGGIKAYKSTGASKADPLNQIDSYGWKINMAAKVINPSAIEVIWTSQGEILRTTTLINANSASGASDIGINCLMPSTATSNGAFYHTMLKSW